MASTLSEEQFRCSICLDIFKNPASIPCGHNFCLECIKRFWDTRQKSECPLCKETFKPRPKLRINLDLKDITEKFKRCLKGQRGLKPLPRLPKQPSKSDVPCDVCHGIKATAIKSCLICQKSYCGLHLTPHLSDPVMTKHRLMDPATFTSSHFCANHNQILEMFCQKDQKPVCIICTEKEHKNHATIPIEKESKRLKIQMKKTKAEFQEMIHNRLKKIEEFKKSMEQSKINKEREVEASVQIFAMAISAIERNQAMFIDEMERKQEAAEKRAEEFLEELRKEINELQRRYGELHYLEHTDDPLHLLQSFLSLSTPLSTRVWSEVRVESDNYIGTLRQNFSKLVDVCRELEKNLSAEEMNKVSSYAVDITLDPETAAGWLVLSPDGKKVSLSSQPTRTSVPDDPRRFDSCVSVLGKQSFTSGRHYWVVQVGDKTDWDLGVARESINRKGAITVRPDSGYWAICRRKGSSLSACAGPCITLHLEQTPQKIGIFLDCEEGSVAFYDADAKTHIYTYSGFTFPEPLYPYFNPCLHDSGKNTAPLVICSLEPVVF
ncbi:E3 ubiquitin-protein ligase TRIM39-like [Mastacembelus armatus]|uniref:E3 ubiquitin-protein ligase TRIM39-like n=1 Tax=Mastacembelus armatus TaxID=205130 RepID=A0A7N8X4V4_9TELE|nr:E3 ubiquitin-protein ligase TRIM39-like [Mastacembelus armatus]